MQKLNPNILIVGLMVCLSAPATAWLVTRQPTPAPSPAPVVSQSIASTVEAKASRLQLAAFCDAMVAAIEADAITDLAHFRDTNNLGQQLHQKLCNLPEGLGDYSKALQARLEAAFGNELRPDITDLNPAAEVCKQVATELRQ